MKIIFGEKTYFKQIESLEANKKNSKRYMKKMGIVFVAHILLNILI